MNNSAQNRWLWALGLALALFLVTRLWNLGALPPFIDELVHIDTAKSARDGDWRAGLGLWKWLSVQSFGLFLNLTDQWPWIRLINVITGLLICLTTFAIVRTGGSARLGFWSVLVYTTLPYAVFFDRLVLTDSFQALFLAVIILLSLRLSRRRSRRDATALGIVLVLAPMFKASGFAFAVVPLVVSLLAGERGRVHRRPVDLWLAYAIFLPAAAWYRLAVLPDPIGVNVGFNPSRLGIVASETVATFWEMLTPPVFLAAILGGLALLLGAGGRAARVSASVYLAVAGISILPFVLLSSSCFPRYFVPALVPIVLLVGEVIDLAAERLKPMLRGGAHAAGIAAVVAVLLVEGSVMSRNMVRDPLSVQFPPAIERQYFTGWGSGYGLDEMVEFLVALGADAGQPIVVLRSPRWHATLQGLDLFERELGDRVVRERFWPWRPESVVETLRERLATRPEVYLLVDNSYPYPNDRPVREAVESALRVEEIWTRDKPGGNPGMTVLAVRPR